MPPAFITSAPTLGKMTDQTGEVLGHASTSPGQIFENVQDHPDETRVSAE